MHGSMHFNKAIMHAQCSLIKKHITHIMQLQIRHTVYSETNQGISPPTLYQLLAMVAEIQSRKCEILVYTSGASSATQPEAPNDVAPAMYHVPFVLQFNGPPESPWWETKNIMFISLDIDVKFNEMFCSGSSNRLRCPLARLSGLQCFNIGP